MGYEYKFIIGKKKFKWPVIFYFAGRYMMLAFFITLYVTWLSTLLLALTNLPSMVNVYAPKYVYIRLSYDIMNSFLIA